MADLEEYVLAQMQASKPWYMKIPGGLQALDRLLVSLISPAALSPVGAAVAVDPLPPKAGPATAISPGTTARARECWKGRHGAGGDPRTALIAQAHETPAPPIQP